MANIIDYHNIKEDGPHDGQPMLFAHGFGCDQVVWRHVAPHFTDRYRVICFDYVGAGRAERPFVQARYEQLQGYADDVVEICERMDLHDVIFVGHSVSCMIGVLAAKRMPGRFAKTIFIGASPHYLNVGDYVGGFSKRDITELLALLDSNYLGWTSKMAPIVAGAPDQPEVRDELKNSFCRMDPAVASVFAATTFLGDNRADLPGHTVPTLVLQASADAISDVAVGRYTSEQIAGSKLIYLQASGHCPHLSGPAEIIDAMESFL